MPSVLYICFGALYLCYLSLGVIKVRKKHVIKYQDGGVDDLIRARSAHSNATEYIPIFLLLLFAYDINGGNVWLTNIVGIAFFAARILHADAIVHDQLKGRILGMQLTFGAIVVMVILNVLQWLFN